ncbi:MAG: dTDP-glucose 4,6-dehydratase [Omnitrophica WOR_2 bacterium GWF2_38_59]|nr:MAG: dTDP-glucose 4,6-dehydratase [Omnitrophica WOR_2 bacterium GWF2_38_59]OGX48279.1 MAG: dTDP-glucose 4,6-dehydratase [Omnitrophica WOR_2 bacterium RIFOXYA2_FULL_38_17]OGX54864.1 MAG: dTDP-glucose 4,6-dehydratase [Omnitrophica WOR_2 bacterium RIFOXYA12_FULL_38_10]OGX59557.1 MAG: dTDP-glucose 4,6-dehydratase [Omnitrophica WOR_2 bacterium RIFOXYC2_FULL_38_12]OGX59948.1 MAG: dTDP-glucose 4,6-dehydratase [Omnitrophica WOR_2 bacterium RIFOXYB2_FULL_38_16]
MSKSYLITGGAGFIGSNFVEYVYKNEPDAKVRVLDKLTYSGNPENIKSFKTKKGFEFIKGDICDKKLVRSAVKDINIVVNFAAEVAVDRSIDEPESFLKTDIFGVYTLLDALRQSDCLQRFIQISTDEVYGQIMEGSFTETSELKPRNPYSASKLGGERLAYSFFETYGLPVIITRASNTYGAKAYPEKVIPLFITNLIEGLQVPVYGKGKQIRDWLFVEDHCSGIFSLIEKGKNGEVYNIGGSQECTNIELTKMILKIMGHDEKMIKFVNDRPGHDFRYSLDTSKLKGLGWSQKYDLQRGMQYTIDWYKNNEPWWKPLKKTLDKRFATGFWGSKGDRK